MIDFTPGEKEFLESREECRIATVHDSMPHIKPISYIFEDGAFLIATDYDTRAFKNIMENPRAALVVDIYKHGDHKAVCIQGKIKIIKDGDRFEEIYAKFHEKFAWVRDDPWKPGEAPFLAITPTSKTSWGV